MQIGLIREGKTPPDNRVTLTPHQCWWIQQHHPSIGITAQTSTHRCFSDREYTQAGIPVQEDLSHCDLILGIKEVPVSYLIPGKTYSFFSHTKKKQPYNQALFQAILDRKITLIDYECLTHEDGQRILGFGFFAGVVGAHNGIMAYGKRMAAFELGRVYQSRSFKALIHTYFELKLPPVRIVATGTGRVSSGVLEIMNLMGIKEVEPDDYLSRYFAYPVYVHLRGQDLYRHRQSGRYAREHFHQHPHEYECLFEPYLAKTDILMNGLYWSPDIPPLFALHDMAEPGFQIRTIADVTNDLRGSIPCNMGDSTIENPIYGVDRLSGLKTMPYAPGSVDVMAIGNLPNELPRDASQYFGEQFIKHLLPEFLKESSVVMDRATMVRKGVLTESFRYLEDYGGL